MWRALLLSALLASTAVPAWALSSPTPAGKDDHVRQVAYDPQNRTALVLQQGMVTNVTFDVMERIERVVLPDENGPVGLLKADKEVNQAPLINNLPLFGAAPGNTDMVVITVSPDGKERPYLFALKVVAAPKDGSEAPDATFSLSFSYPIQERAAAQAKAQTSWKEKQANQSEGDRRGTAQHRRLLWRAELEVSGAGQGARHRAGRGPRQRPADRLQVSRQHGAPGAVRGAGRPPGHSRGLHDRQGHRQ